MNLATRLNRLEKLGADDTRPWLVLDLSGTNRYTDAEIQRLKDETRRRSPGLRILVLDVVP